MAAFKCKNFGSCSLADSGEEMSLAGGADDKCRECSSSLFRVGDGRADSEDESGSPKRKRSIVAAAVGVAFVLIAGGAYTKWGGNSAVVLKPDATLPPSQSSAPASEQAPVVPAPVASNPTAAPAEVPAAAKPAPMLANEAAARKTCDEATKAGAPDAGKVCKRAAAVTLMNSGVLSAVEGKLEQAEKDYLAAKDKDPDFPELYFNLAVLKARQEKGAEAIDNLTLAGSKGFTQFSAIKSEPALQKLKTDVGLKAKLEAFEAK